MMVWDVVGSINMSVFRIINRSMLSVRSMLIRIDRLLVVVKFAVFVHFSSDRNLTFLIKIIHEVFCLAEREFKLYERIILLLDSRIFETGHVRQTNIELQATQRSFELKFIFRANLWSDIIFTWIFFI